MSIVDDQRPLIEEALRVAEVLMVRSWSWPIRQITENLREVVRLYGEDGQIVAGSAPYEERAESRPCKGGCGEPFQPGQSYVVDGPFHIGCAVLDERRRGRARGY